MAIKFGCACGKAIRVPDDYAGRSVDCPDCGRGMTVPGGTRVEPPRSPPVVASAGPGRWTAGRIIWGLTASLVGGVVLMVAFGMFMMSKPTSGAVARPPAPGTPSDATMMAGFLLVVVLPILVPIALSRARCLSLGRWLCVAAFSFGSSLVIGALGLAVDRPILLGPALMAFFGTGGSILAAAFHPRPVRA